MKEEFFKKPISNKIKIINKARKTNKKRAKHFIK
jgi:hypothetical protein